MDGKRASKRAAANYPVKASIRLVKGARADLDAAEQIADAKDMRSREEILAYIEHLETYLREPRTADSKDAAALVGIATLKWVLNG